MATIRYVSDTEPGIRRLRSGRGYSYHTPDGRLLRDPEELRRIRSLVIPPAWQDVWISPLRHSHLQATGRDARGRKQYRYHPRWRQSRDAVKYGHLLEFGQALPVMRRRLQADLSLRGLPRDKVLAAMVRLLETTLMRIGNREYRRQNGSFGLSTLLDEHARIQGEQVTLSFVGKGQVRHSLSVRDRQLATIVRRCRDLPGVQLFQYIDETGRQRDVGSGDVNGYLREISGQEFTAKDFRTWAGTLNAWVALKAMPAAETETANRKSLVAAVRHAAEQLGNTPAVCRACYIHPSVLEAFASGDLARFRDQVGVRKRRNLSIEESELLAFLERQTRWERRAA